MSIPGLDDFENNNPFAEPAQHDHSEVTEHEPEPSEVESHENDEENQQYDEHNLLLTEDELRRLLPERFTNKYSLSIKITAVEKNKSDNPIVKFNVSVKGLPRYRQDTYKDVRRTYNEVVKFNNYLTISNLEVFVPVIPLAATSFPSGSDDENKHLLSLWQEWFNRITNNPILVRDEEFVYFVESDFGYSVINSSKKSSVASGLVRKTLKQLAVPYDPYQELAEFRPVIKASYLTCQKLYRLLDKNSKVERQLSIHVSELSQKLSALAQFETTHPGMRNMWDKLGKIMQILADLTMIELISEMASLGDGTQAFINDFYQIKEALTNRHLIMRELIQAEAQTKSKHQQATKIKSKSALDPFKVDEAIRSLEYATKAEESLNLQVKRISGEMLYERKEVIDYTESKFQKLLKSYTLSKVEHHRKILKHLENIRLDIRIIDEKGGLSRLNRDNLTSLKHNLTQSQSANGDSWTSRTFRSLTKEEAEHEEPRELNDDSMDAKNAATLLSVATF